MFNGIESYLIALMVELKYMQAFLMYNKKIALLEQDSNAGVHFIIRSAIF